MARGAGRPRIRHECTNGAGRGGRASNPGRGRPRMRHGCADGADGAGRGGALPIRGAADHEYATNARMARRARADHEYATNARMARGARADHEYATNARMARAAGARFAGGPAGMRRARADHGYATDARMRSPRGRGSRVGRRACGGRRPTTNTPRMRGWRGGRGTRSRPKASNGAVHVASPQRGHSLETGALVTCPRSWRQHAGAMHARRASDMAPPYRQRSLVDREPNGMIGDEPAFAPMAQTPGAGSCQTAAGGPCVLARRRPRPVDKCGR